LRAIEDEDSADPKDECPESVHGAKPKKLSPPSRADAENSQETSTIASHYAEIRRFKRTELLVGI
jgi:hypothetical protein